MSTDQIRFSKYQGTGNDFVILDNRSYQFSDDELVHLAEVLCRRRLGIGADGLLALSAPRTTDANYRMQYLNADGSWATMCGNGARCLADFARKAGIEGPFFAVESDAGMYHVRLNDESDGLIRLYFDLAGSEPEQVDLDDFSDGEIQAMYEIWSGTEHLVCSIRNLERTPVEEWGRMLRQHEHFKPEGTNVNFVDIQGASGVNGDDVWVRTRTYEKGVEEETRACGTGAIAVAGVVRAALNPDARRVGVEMPGGMLYVGWEHLEGIGERTYLEGHVQFVFRGTVDLSDLPPPAAEN